MAADVMTSWWKYDWEKTIQLYTQYIFMQLKKQPYVAVLACFFGTNQHY